MGRAEELDRIVAAMGNPAAPGFLLAGAAGVGKSRLAQEVLAGADRQRFVALSVTGTTATTDIPFSAFGPLLPVELPAAGDRVNLLRWAADTLARQAGNRRLVLWVDDAHLLDETSAALLYHLARARTAFVLACVRSGERAPAPVTALWCEGLVERVELRALPSSGVAAVLTDALGGQVEGATTHRLTRAAQGNMLWLRELVTAGLERGALTRVSDVWCWRGPWTIPPRLSELIAQRIGHLSAGERQAAELIAYGEPIGADLVERLASRADLRAVEAKNLLRVERDGRRTQIYLVHPLYGETLRATCPPLRAADYRRRLAVAVEATGARRHGDSLRIATWRLAAGDQPSVAVLTDAARRAFALLDLPLAERLARASFDAGDTAAVDMLWRVLFLTGRHGELEQFAVRLWTADLPEAKRAELAIGRAYNLFFGLTDVPRAHALLDRTETDLTDPVWRDEVDLLRSAMLVCAARPHDALAVVQARLSRPDTSARAAAQAGVVSGMALTSLGRLTEAKNTLAAAAASMAPWAATVPWPVETCELFRCYAALLTGELAEAEAMAGSGYQRASNSGWAFATLLACLARAQTARMRGRMSEARKWAQEGLAVGSGAGGMFTDFVLGELAHCHALLGHVNAAQAALTEADAHPRESEALMRQSVELARPWVELAGGDRQAATNTAWAYARQTRQAGFLAFEALALHDVVRLGDAVGAAGRLQELAGIVDGRLVPLLALHARAVADEDSAGMTAAGAALAEVGAALWAAEAYARAAHTHQAAGRPGDAARCSGQATLLLAGCGDVRTPALDLLRAPRLTARERDIAVLAAAGHSSNDIATSLVLSIRTVDNHLHRVYAKLGIDGRHQLAPFLAVRSIE